MIKIQDGKGNFLREESILATIKQFLCIHKWMPVGFTYECPKCMSVKKQ